MSEENVEIIRRGYGHFMATGEVRAHPDLGARARMTPDSTREQAGAGLDRLAPDEYEALMRANDMEDAVRALVGHETL